MCGCRAAPCALGPGHPCPAVLPSIVVMIRVRSAGAVFPGIPGCRWTPLPCSGARRAGTPRAVAERREVRRDPGVRPGALVQKQTRMALNVRFIVVSIHSATGARSSSRTLRQIVSSLLSVATSTRRREAGNQATWVSEQAAPLSSCRPGRGDVEVVVQRGHPHGPSSRPRRCRCRAPSRPASPVPRRARTPCER